MKDPFFYTRKREKLTNKFWFQFLIMPFGGVVVLVTLGLLLEPLGNILVKVPVVGVGFEKLCRVVNAPCGVREPDPTYLVNDEEVESLFQSAFSPEDENNWLKSKAREYREAISKNSKNAAAWTNLGEVLRRLGKPKQALEAHQKALAIDPNLQEALIGLAKTQRDLGKFALADEARKKALQINPNNQVVTEINTGISGGGTSKKFFCGSSDGIPTTMVQSPQENYALIRWTSDLVSTWTPEQRCQEVTKRLQYYYKIGKLKYITTGIMKDFPIICVTDRKGGVCSGLLFTLKRGTNPNEVLKGMWELSSRRRVEALEIE